MSKGCVSCPYGPGNFEEYAMAKQDPSTYCPDAYSERAQYCGMYDNPNGEIRMSTDLNDESSR